MWVCCNFTIQLNETLNVWAELFLSILTVTTFKLLYYCSCNLCPHSFQFCVRTEYLSIICVTLSFQIQNQLSWWLQPDQFHVIAFFPLLEISSSFHLVIGKIKELQQCQHHCLQRPIFFHITKWLYLGTASSVY